jgi:hypothetical protein
MMPSLPQVGHGYRAFNAEYLPTATGVEDSGQAPVGASQKSGL